ncbi:type IV secretion system DNA-binding domain-containing protein [Aetokthonos hydrillicola Thurmond2011]|jgi:type IV secretory pathway TraG/TraD family ATPase VirD4|uniref:Type IV secretion system DNA-binding domain-containing protein n=1 Tax=Aetokthonos hydrillicola Thurmond2011 TaxID=2712845 RepID=A0AAP5ME83_9CYAN|nr:type IV secretion system DNA-binding domain-containing protein [Aetokthonos hydrillicola]MBW4590089.1 type IV secretion system DNA-binding domain-containing protein [Aetokthonos hydrillicola CCALA 1050]MDR9900678.1 type IV secretion system DNA-binding domain-containing protein [Aetokthonos hydrillicola Thurmond2011]
MMDKTSLSGSCTAVVYKNLSIMPRILQRFLERFTLERLSEQFIEEIATLEADLESFWNNVLYSWTIICVWVVISLFLIWIIPPFAFFKFLMQSDLIAVFSLGVIGLFIISVFLKPIDTKRTIGLFILWAIIMGMSGVSLTAMRTASADGRWLVSLCRNLYAVHPFPLAGWYIFSAWHTLFLVFRHGRAKLRHYWILLLTGFILLTLSYFISPSIGFYVALVAPNEWFNNWLCSMSEKDLHLRGNKRVSTRRARYDYRKRLTTEARASTDTFLFGGVDVPIQELTYHLVAVGSSGSGKSITLKLIMQACLPKVSLGNGIRAVVFDPKHNAVGEIRGIGGLEAEIITLNPFYRGFARYDIAKDFRNIVHAQSFADILIPEAKNGERGDKFFRDAAVNILTGITLLFIANAPGDWRLSDIVRAFSTDKVLVALLSSNPQTAMYINSLGTEKTLANIIASVCADVYKYIPIAALWEHASSSVSVKEWLHGGQVWILGEAEEARPTINALNRLILTRMSQSLLNETDYPAPRTFIFLDELQSIQVEALNEIATKGRSKGICLIMAFQSIQGMYLRYGREVSDSILGQIRHKAFLKMSDDATARWASSQIGDMEIRRQQATSRYQTGAGNLIEMSSRTGATQSIQQTAVVMPSEFIGIEPVHAASNTGLTGFYQAHSNWKNYTRWDKLKSLLQPPSPSGDDTEVPDSWMQLPPWTEEDWVRLGIQDAMYNVMMGGSPAPAPTPSWEEEYSSLFPEE